MPTNIRDLVPDKEELLRLDAASIGGYVLECLLSQDQSERGIWHRRNFAMSAAAPYSVPGMGLDRDVMAALSEGWSWLQSNGLICEDPEQPSDGWFVPTRKGRKVREAADVRGMVAAQELPEHFLHPLIAQSARTLFMQGRRETAVFEAFKTLEVQVRRLAGLPNDVYGAKVFARAFSEKDGPLVDRSLPEGERTALLNLMQGAYGAWRNPHGHANRPLDVSEARDAIILASRLLLMAESRSI